MPHRCRVARRPASRRRFAARESVRAARAPAYDDPVTPSRDKLQGRITELERERELLNAIANYAPSLLCIVDAEGRARPAATNRAFELALGYPSGETGGEPFWERYVSPEDADEAKRMI